MQLHYIVKCYCQLLILIFAKLMLDLFCLYYKCSAECASETVNNLAIGQQLMKRNYETWLLGFYRASWSLSTSQFNIHAQPSPIQSDSSHSCQSPSSSTRCPLTVSSPSSFLTFSQAFTHSLLAHSSRSEIFSTLTLNWCLVPTFCDAGNFSQFSC